MRPRRLELEGFGAFRDRTEVDFDGVELFALSGPTGSGKSTVIDAICFALYGSIPRYDDRRLVAPAISQGLPEARVRLDFTIDGASFSAVRVVKRTRSGATTKEARLEDGDGTVLAGNEKELTAAVESLLGLTYEHFTKSVVLPQGDFARFLHDKPDKRQELLVELLDLGVYGTMAGLAHERARDAQRDARAAEDRLAALADATVEARATATTRAEQLAQLRAELEEVLDAVVQLADAARGARDEARVASARVDVLAGVVVPEAVASLADALLGADVEARRSATSEDDAIESTAKAEAQLLALRPRRELEQLGAAHDERTGHLAQHAKGAGLRQAALQVEAEMAVALEQASTAAAAAADAIERVLVAHAAHALREHLAVGEPCPVCEQAVAALPTEVAVADIDAARATQQQLERKRERAAKAAADAQRERERIDDKLTSIDEQLRVLDARLADEPGADAVARLLQEVGEVEQSVEEARGAERVARSQRVAALAALDGAREAEQRARRDLHAAHVAVAPLGAPAPEGSDLVADWDALARWAAAEAPAQQALAATALAAAVSIDRDRVAAEDALLERVAAAGVAVTTIAGVRDEVVAAHTRALHAIERIDEQLAEADVLRGALGTHVEREQVALALHRHLGARGFEKWVLDEALHGLVEAATSTLLELSGQQYSLCLDERGFAVVDHRNADQVRSARSLSGGETFLASLALALALADQLAMLAGRGHARLEALFLDEGFGTLDADTLDTVASAIDELGSRGRMVGVISHVAELADRVPVRYEVRKLANASTIERIEQ